MTEPTNVVGTLTESLGAYLAAQEAAKAAAAALENEGQAGTQAQETQPSQEV
jgi:hypothetical protein